MIPKNGERLSEEDHARTREESRMALDHPALPMLNVLRACRAAEKLDEAEA
jgi:hypothetical protein